MSRRTVGESGGACSTEKGRFARGWKSERDTLSLLGGLCWGGDGGMNGKEGVICCRYGFLHF